MRKPDFCICENKGADQLCGNRTNQLCGNCTTNQRLCFRYTDSTIPLLSKCEISFKPLASFCDCTARFVSDLVGNPEDRFSHNEAHIFSAKFLHPYCAASNESWLNWNIGRRRSSEVRIFHIFV